MSHNEFLQYVTECGEVFRIELNDGPVSKTEKSMKEDKESLDPIEMQTQNLKNGEGS